MFEIAWSSHLGRRIIQCLGYPIRHNDGDRSVRKMAEMLNRDALRWLAERPPDRPFFVFINYYDAHRTYVLHQDPQSRFGKAALPPIEQGEILSEASWTWAWGNVCQLVPIQGGFMTKGSHCLMIVTTLALPILINRLDCFLTKSSAAAYWIIHSWS